MSKKSVVFFKSRIVIRSAKRIGKGLSASQVEGSPFDWSLIFIMFYSDINIRVFRFSGTDLPFRLVNLQGYVR